MDKGASSARRTTANRKSLGLCVKCTKPARPGWTQCSDCSEAGKRHTKMLKTEVMNAYGGCCSCCGETYVDFLNIDHIHNDGNEDRRNGRSKGIKLYRELKKTGFPQGRLQVLCSNCNGSKHINGGHCPCPRGEERRRLLPTQ